MKVEHTKGLIAAPLTGFHKDGTINLKIVEEYAQFLQRNGIIGVFVNGTTGSAHLLGLQERMDLAAKWVEVIPKGMKIIVHVGHTSITDASILAKHAQDIGATAISSMAPLFLKPDMVETVVDHCAREAAAAPDLPYYYYNIPSLSGVQVNMVDYARLAGQTIPTFVGLKFTKCDPFEYALCRAVDGGKYDVLWGYDEDLIAALAVGGQGAVGGSYNFAAPVYYKLIKAFAAGDVAKAREYAFSTMQMVDVYLRVGHFHANLYAIMRMVGLDLGRVRSPLVPNTPAQDQQLKAELEKVGFSQFCAK